MTTTTKQYDETQLRCLGLDGLKEHAKDLGVYSGRGRAPKEETLIEKILAAYDSPNGNGSAGPKLAKGTTEEGETEPTTVAASTEKKKDIAVELMSAGDAGPFLQDIGSIVAEHHPHLENARFKLFWKYNFRKADDTNRVKLGEIKKADEVHRELCDKGDLGQIDFLVFVNYDEFGKGEPRPALRIGMLDNLLESCKPVEVDGAQKRDSADRLLWRIEKPLQVHPAVIARRGFMTMEEIELAQACALHKVQKPLFD